MKFKHLLFDLDHTLWDYDKNARETLLDIYQLHGLHQFIALSEEEFVCRFLDSNAYYWSQFNQGLMDKEQLRLGRFITLLESAGEESIALAKIVAQDFTEQCPKKPFLMPNALALLENLYALGYQLHILTNGFRESQIQKINSAGISHFFSSVTTSECSGYRKPMAEFFQVALYRANATPDQAMMLGDNPDTDIAGAVLAGIEAVWYNPMQSENHSAIKNEISDLLDLLKILQH